MRLNEHDVNIMFTYPKRARLTEDVGRVALYRIDNYSSLTGGESTEIPLIDCP